MDTVPVRVGSDTGLGNLVLVVGSVSTSIEVTNAPPEIENTQAQISTTLTDSTIAVFPGILENQGLDMLALTVPGVVNNRDLGFANPNGVGFAVNGIRGRNNDQQIDGQNNNDNSVAGPSLFLSDSEFVSEYQITTSNFGAEYGRNSGSVVNIVTKSGTNNYHGSLYATDNNQRFDTLSNTQKAFEGLTSVPTFNDLFLGGTIGGPIIKDKLFFFAGDDAEIINSSNVYGTGLLTPTPAGIATLRDVLSRKRRCCRSPDLRSLFDQRRGSHRGRNASVSECHRLQRRSGKRDSTHVAHGFAAIQFRGQDRFSNHEKPFLWPLHL